MDTPQRFALQSFLAPRADAGAFAFFLTLCFFLVLLVAAVVCECRWNKKRSRLTYLYMLSTPFLLGSIILLSIFSIREMELNRLYDYRGLARIAEVSVVAVHETTERLASYEAVITVGWPTCSSCRSIPMQLKDERSLCEASCEQKDEDCRPFAEDSVRSCADNIAASGPLYVDGDCGSCTATLPNRKVSQKTLLWAGSIMALSSIAVAVLVNAARILFIPTAQLRDEHDSSDLSSVGRARTVSMSSCDNESVKMEP